MTIYVPHNGPTAVAARSFPLGEPGSAGPPGTVGFGDADVDHRTSAEGLVEVHHSAPPAAGGLAAWRYILPRRHPSGKVRTGPVPKDVGPSGPKASQARTVTRSAVCSTSKPASISSR
ncbi:hypothetical protein [Parafrankia sp. EUN1f]|uniref:hypothetical protein n=1 Tax=Parafrankia sp. EUN1f TaxID=102897 RepID=UPI0012F7A819|nr:hypothetical protein [Parafrankia sp. EUN1f]